MKMVLNVFRIYAPDYAYSVTGDSGINYDKYAAIMAYSRTELLKAASDTEEQYSGKNALAAINCNCKQFVSKHALKDGNRPVVAGRLEE